MARNVLEPFAARPLRPMMHASHESRYNGPLQPDQSRAIARGSRPVVSAGGYEAAGGGWPAPLTRQYSFPVILRPPVPVNIVTGVPSNPGNARLTRRRRGRRWTL